MSFEVNKTDSKFSKLVISNWRPFAYILALGFVAWTLFSVGKSLFMMPKLTVDKSELPIASDKSTASFAQKQSLPTDELDLIINRNLFNRDGTHGDMETKNMDEQTSTDQGLVKTELPLTLVGLIYGGTPYNGLATIEQKSKNKVASYIVGDLIEGVDARLEEIRRDRIIFSRGGRREYLELEQKDLVRSSRKKRSSNSSEPVKKGVAPIARGPALKAYREEGFERDNGKMVMTDTFKQRLLGPDFTKVLQDAKATPNMVDGQIKGFRLTRIREDSIYQKAGLQNDDVVMEINGVPLNNAASAIRLLQGLRNESEIEVIVDRSGSQFPMTLSIQ